MSSNCQATLTTAAQDLELLWHDSEWGKAFETVGFSWRDVHVGICTTLYSLLVWTHITLLLAPGKKTLVCILCLTKCIIQNITQGGDCEGTNVSEGEYIKTLTNRSASEVQSVPGVDRSYRHRCWGEGLARPIQRHLLKVAVSAGSPGSSPQTTPHPSWPRAFWSRCILFQRPQ